MQCQPRSLSRGQTAIGGDFGGSGPPMRAWGDPAQVTCGAARWECSRKFYAMVFSPPLVSTRAKGPAGNNRNDCYEAPAMHRHGARRRTIHGLQC
jgi:hypothetical protein